MLLHALFNLYSALRNICSPLRNIRSPLRNIRSPLRNIRSALRNITQVPVMRKYHQAMQDNLTGNNETITTAFIYEKQLV